MAARPTSRDKPARRERLVALGRSLPEADVSGEQHLAFRVRGKTFAWYVDDHHGDGRVALHAKAARGEQTRLVRAAPARFFVPPYVGVKGWVGLWLDLARVDWSEALALLVEAYRLTAPAKLAARVDEGRR